MSTDPTPASTPLRDPTIPTDGFTAPPDAPASPVQGEALSDNASFVSKAPAENMVDGQITEGVPVFDAHGDTIGNVAAYDEAAGRLVIRGGWLFAQDTPLPVDAIGDRGASGLYLRQSKEELAQQYGQEQTAGAAAAQERPAAAAPDQSAALASSPPAPEPATMARPAPDAAAGGASGRLSAEGSEQPPMVFTAAPPPDQERGLGLEADAAGPAAPVSGMMDARPAPGMSTVTVGRETPAPVTARPAGDGRTTRTLTKYLGDLHALESHILQALDKQVRLLPDHPDVRMRLRAYRNTLEEHLDALETRLQDLGGSPTHPVKEAVSAVLGMAAGLYDKARSEQASKDLRDDYTALNHALIATAMLHTTALALGDQPTAALCARHLRDHARFVMEINQALPALVVAELRQDRLPVAGDALEAARRTMHEIWQQPS